MKNEKNVFSNYIPEGHAMSLLHMAFLKVHIAYLKILHLENANENAHECIDLHPSQSTVLLDESNLLPQVPNSLPLAGPMTMLSPSPQQQTVPEVDSLESKSTI